MPKPGYTQIIVSNEVRQILEKTARESGFKTVNNMLKHLIESTLLYRVNPGSTPNLYDTIQLTPIQTLNQQNNLNQTAFNENVLEGKRGNRRFSQIVGPPGFEPGSREPESRSLDQASRRPLADFELF